MVRNALLVIEAKSTPGVSFLIKQANPDAEQLINPVGVPLIGAILDQLPPPFNSTALRNQLEQVLDEGINAHFSLVQSLMHSRLVFDCRLLKADSQLLVLSMLVTESKEMELLEQVPESMEKYGESPLDSFQEVTQDPTTSLLESVMNSSPAAIRYYESIRDESGQIIDFMSSTGNELSAYLPYRPTQSIIGKRLLELYPYLKDNGLFDRYVAVVESGQSDHFETSRELENRVVWFDCMAIRHGNGFVLTTLDITASKMAQLNLEGQADLIKGVLNSSSSSILVLEPIEEPAGHVSDFLITLANPATGRLFFPFLGRDFTQEETLTHSLLTLFPEVKERALYPALMSVVNTGEAIHASIEYPELGLTYDYDLRPFRRGVLMITTDSTPLRVYQQQLEANNIALSRSNEYLQQFAYVASHDLQEPLRKIQSFGDMLLTQYADVLDATGQDLLRRQQHAAQRMQSLVKDLLNYSRLSTEQLPFQPISLQLLMQDVIGDLETTIRETGAVVRVDSLPTIKGNATQLRQLLQNLLTNALKFTKPGQPPLVEVGSFLLKADQLPQPRLTADQGQWVALRVADEGIGFDTAYKERIFELFQRLHGRSQYTGTGIGLAVVKKVVENHRGQITAHSQPGEGSTFTIYLPMA